VGVGSVVKHEVRDDATSADSNHGSDHLRPSWWSITLAVVVGASVAILLRTNVVGAAFAASDRLGSNRLESATLDISEGTNSTDVHARNMAPGDTAFGILHLENTGTLPLIYSLVASVDTGGLADNLRFRLWPGPQCDEPPDETGVADVVIESTDGAVILGNPEVGIQDGDRAISVGESDVLCYSISLPLDATNSAQGETSTQTFIVIAEHDISNLDTQGPDELRDPA
jgi:hypothetical protein